MSRRKHVTLQALSEDVDPPGEDQHIVRVVCSRGSNIMEVKMDGQVELGAGSGGLEGS